MTKSPTAASPVKTQTSPASKSLLSRVVAPFSSKTRSPVEQEIRLDEPFRQYIAGDIVKGAVLVNTTKASRITHLVIRLHGFVKVVNHARLPGETIPYDENLLASMTSRRGIEYFGNGFARLFEDERVLCGDGRLGGTYEFRFELQLPQKNLPSSIDFEHGTISYLLTSTLTRPTTISPTLTYHHKLNVTGTIDIARLQLPKPHIVSLESVNKKAKSRIRAKRKSTGLQNGRDSVCSSVDEGSVNRITSSSPQSIDVPPRSPVPSIISSASAGSSNASANVNVLRTLPPVETNGDAENFDHVIFEKTITAKTELLQGGCLPGDTLALRITIDHAKPVKTMQGLITTVFRQGRIDTHPALPIGESNGKRRFEDYYAKSRTGLGGLSLSSAGSSRVFRQDLAQNITPLIIDPSTLTANIKTSIQMPDHAFPTIACVPGGMISFKYYVEVVIDLRARTVGQDRFLPQLSITNAPQHSYGDPRISKKEGVNCVSYCATPGFNYLITDQLRRTKGVVFTTTEVIVGTRDSARARCKQRSSSVVSDHGREQQVCEVVSPHPHEQQARGIVAPLAAEYGRASTPILPPPDLEEPLDEKTQIRRAEERLLPSAPPQDDELSPTTIAPSAPFAHDEEDFVNRYRLHAPAPAYDEPSTIGSSRQSQTHAEAVPLPMSPDAAPSDDKQELELIRLQALRSEPPGENEATAGVESCDQSHQPLQPCAPVLDEDSSRTEPIHLGSSLSSSGVVHDAESATYQVPQQALSNSTLEEVESAHTHDDDDDNKDDDLPVYKR